MLHRSLCSHETELDGVSANRHRLHEELLRILYRRGLCFHSNASIGKFRPRPLYPWSLPSKHFRTSFSFLLQNITTNAATILNPTTNWLPATGHLFWKVEIQSRNELTNPILEEFLHLDSRKAANTFKAVLKIELFDNMWLNSIRAWSSPDHTYCDVKGNSRQIK